MTTKNDKHPTSQLFDLANSALCAGDWSLARSYLDDLGLRSDNTDTLASADAYGVPAVIATLIQDRIDLVNSKAELATL